jgi:hypothetical protein
LHPHESSRHGVVTPKIDSGAILYATRRMLCFAPVPSADCIQLVSDAAPISSVVAQARAARVISENFIKSLFSIWARVQLIKGGDWRRVDFEGHRSWTRDIRCWMTTPAARLLELRAV